MDIRLCNTNETITFESVLYMWLTSNKIHIKNSTYDKYRYIIDRHITPDLGHRSLEEINTVIINQFLDNKLKTGGINTGLPLAPSYVATMALIISSTIHFAANENLCKEFKNPIFKPNPNNKSINILSKYDTEKLMNYISKNLNESGVGVLLALYTGLRIGEICALKWENIDLFKKVILVDSTVSRIKHNGKTVFIIGSPKTKNSKRLIPIPKRLLILLKDAYKNRKSEYVISTKADFVIPRTFEYRYHKILKDLHIESINFHTLRHTFATTCISNGMDVKSLSEILGHSNINTTMQIYVHPSMEIKMKQINKVFH